MTKPARRIILLPAFVFLLLFTGCTGAYHPYRVVGNSMLPLLPEGERIFADESEQTRTILQDGEIILFRTKDGRILIKRILALPGETIEGKDRKVFRNGKQIDEPYLAAPNNAQPVLSTFPRRTVPNGELFVAGDNRDLSLDSRFEDYPPVHLSDVVGRYAFTYWHAGKK